MSSVLIINSHPLTAVESNTLKLLQRFEAVYRHNNPEDTITKVDLYESDLPEIDADLLRGCWGKARSQVGHDAFTEQELDKMARFDYYTKQFLDADKIVVANPLWNLNVPTRLKAWIDTVNVAGKTFKYTAEGPVPLTQGKKALHLQSNGGTYNSQDTAAKFVKEILNFVGVEDYNQVFVEGIDYTPDRADQILDEALIRVSVAATNF